MEEPAWGPQQLPTLDPVAWRPVAAGLWRQHEMFDGTYDVDDLVDVLEFLDVREENQSRYEAWANSAAGKVG